MVSPSQKRILEALFASLRPIARALLRYGIGYKEFASVSKAAFIQEASDEYGLRGRPTNTSRVSAMTGISRKEVAAYRRRNLDGYVADPIAVVPPAVVLQRWFNDERFVDDAGHPKILAFEEESSSFADLVRACTGDHTPGAMRAELKRVGAIVETEDKRLKAVSRYFVPAVASEKLVIGLEDGLMTLASSVAVNSHPDLVGLGHLQQVAGVEGISPEDFQEIKQHARRELMEFLRKFDDYLAGFETVEQAEGEVTQIGIGAYYFELIDGK
jgi:hypothetical protein